MIPKLVMPRRMNSTCSFSNGFLLPRAASSKFDWNFKITFQIFYEKKCKLKRALDQVLIYFRCQHMSLGFLVTSFLCRSRNKRGLCIFENPCNYGINSESWSSSLGSFWIQACTCLLISDSNKQVILYLQVQIRIFIKLCNQSWMLQLLSLSLF